MSLRELVSKPEIWIPSILTAIGALWAWATYGKRKTRVEIDKTEIEKESSEFTLKERMEQYYDKKIEGLTSRIKELERKDQDKDLIIAGLRKQIEDQNIIIQQLQANENFNKTLNSKP